MDKEKLSETLEKANLTAEQIREIIHEEIDKKEEEKQEECDHSRSGKLIDGKLGIVKCSDCGKLLDMTESSVSASEIPPRMQVQIDNIMKKRAKKG